ncbi:MAG: hypothetical protein HQK50_11555 [Oligoflexia bacterium]|nr:hypothetical protein [Oligoflexia bacterium]
MKPEQQLHKLIEDIGYWRKNKKQAKERMPEDLFNRAINLHLNHPDVDITSFFAMILNLLFSSISADYR